MARGVNKVILIGNLCKDPESRVSASGSTITNLVVATSESWKDKQSGEKKEQSEFHRVSMFNKLGEIAAQFLTKGSKVYIEGSLRTRKWQDKDGKDNYTTEIVASEMQMLSGKGDSVEQHTAPAKQQKQPAQQYQAPVDDFNDDIPF